MGQLQDENGPILNPLMGHLHELWAIFKPKLGHRGCDDWAINGCLQGNKISYQPISKTSPNHFKSEDENYAFIQNYKIMHLMKPIRE